MTLFLLLTDGGGALLLALGFLGIVLGRRRGRPKNDVGVLAAVLLIAGFVLLCVSIAGVRTVLR